MEEALASTARGERGRESLLRRVGFFDFVLGFKEKTGHGICPKTASRLGFYGGTEKFEVPVTGYSH